MRNVLLILCLIVCCNAFSQAIENRISSAMSRLETDPQCRNGMIALYIADSKTGHTIFNKNADIGLAPASCQKIVTSVTAFELLGNNYTYKTQLGYSGNIANGLLTGNIIITGNGDPTLGSWRYEKTRENIILDQFVKAINKEGITDFTGPIISGNPAWGTQTIPGGWTWEDMGNYYGAGASALNWRENQYDLVLQAGKRNGDSVKIMSTEPSSLQGVNLINELTTAAAGTGDNSIIYLAPGASSGYIRGTIPLNENRFVVSGSLPDAGLQLSATLANIIHPDFYNIKMYSQNQAVNEPVKNFFTYISPSLDSINYWFLKKSVNLYGEALLKTLAFEKTKQAFTDTGVHVVKDFWRARGIEATALNIIDGSGLSPANRVTARALTTILQFAKQKTWFASFYNALPEINRIRMKSGSISGVLSYAGFVKGKDGKDFTFAFMINNFNGSASALRQKMWKLLDVLK